MKKIYFYSPRALGPKALDTHMYINTVPLYLTSYLRNNRPDLLAQLTWCKFQFCELPRARLIQEIQLTEADILCVSVYIWNVHVLEHIKDIKRDLGRPVTIIVGGPSVEVFRDRSYLDRHPDIDYAIFAQGEQAFLDAMDRELTGKKLNVVSTCNLAWREGDATKIGQFKYHKMGHFSPFLENQDLLRQIIHDPDYSNFAFIVPYETSKGCAYNCSFCDWTSGMSHMTSHRKFDIESELDMLGSLGLTNFHPSDANFGEHRQDIVIARTMARLKHDKGYPFYIRDTNLSKMKKKEAFEILEVLIDANILRKPKFAVQDIHPHILANVDRPDTPWDVHAGYIRDLKQRYPHVMCEIELLVGLPGQTRDTWEQTLIAMQGLTPICYPWAILPNSPAGYDPAYRERWQIKTMMCKISSQGTHFNEIVVGSLSYDFADYCYFHLLAALLRINFIDAMPDRPDLFVKVRHSQYLETALLGIGRALASGQTSQIHVVTAEFVRQIMREYKWDKSVLKSCLDFFRDPGANSYQWWDSYDSPKKTILEPA